MNTLPHNIHISLVYIGIVWVQTPNIHLSLVCSRTVHIQLLSVGVTILHSSILMFSLNIHIILVCSNNLYVQHRIYLTVFSPTSTSV